ncbi:MAG: extracellular solute-binding protein [Oscillospiraceae bacterium]|nr:extracellular solute-binding protein [Oscillospiraceae bacterium]
MKKSLAILLALVMVFALAVPTAFAADDVEITLWTYPIGGWGNSDTVGAMVEEFEAANPGIKVTVEYLDYTNGDDQVNTALEGNAAPDLIMEGPERLVANWGAKGYMVDLADMWDDTDKAEVNPSVVAACFNAEGACYEYPVCMTAHCMAINLARFQAVGADQYLDLDNHTWTTEGFIEAVKLLAAENPNVAAIFCSGQGGDQGTRAIVNNLYSGTFTNPEHTAYTADSEENIKALQLLYDLEGVNYDASINGGEEINLFRQGILDMAFCWNIGAQNNVDAGNEPGFTNDGDQIVFMAFPSDDGVAELCGGIWGFGVFDNGDAAKIDAAKTFVKYFADGEGTVSAVKASTYFAVRDAAEGMDLSGIWADNEVMNEYGKLMPLLGDYYQVVPGWATARTEWWNMLQRIGDGGDVATEVGVFVENANAAAMG